MKITISDTALSGNQGMMAQIIRAALSEYGVKCDIKDNEGNPFFFLGTLPPERVEKLKGRTINIKLKDKKAKPRHE